MPRHLSSRLPGCFPRTAPQPYKQDFDKAEDLLDAAGWTDSDGDGIRDKEINGRRVPFEFTLHDVSDRRPASKCATLMKECLDENRHHLQCEADRVHRALRAHCRNTNSKPRSAAGARAPIPTRRQTFIATGEARNYGQLFEPPRRRALQARPPRIRPRKAGRDLRRNPQHPVGRSALHVALLSQRVLRLQQETSRLQLLPARPVQFQPRHSTASTEPRRDDCSR